MLLNYGHMFTILPFGNATVVGNMTGAQILELLHQSRHPVRGRPPALGHPLLASSATRMRNPGPQPYGWGAYDVEVYDKATSTWEPLDLAKTYRVGTNEFLAPAGQDGFTPFKYLTNISYWGDMLNAVNDYVAATYTFADPYLGPDGDGTLDGRITRDGDGHTYEAGEIVPLTILHHNDSHGNLDKGSYVGYTQLAALIKQERLHNPDRTLLLSSGDNIQGDAMMYYFKTAPTGFAADGTPSADPDHADQPLIKAFNAMGYDAMTLGNHEFNFGKRCLHQRAGAGDLPAPPGQHRGRRLVRARRRRTSSPTSRRRPGRHRRRDPGHRQPPCPELRAAQQHSRPDVHRPDRQDAGALRRCCAPPTTWSSP